MFLIGYPVPVLGLSSGVIVSLGETRHYRIFLYLRLGVYESCSEFGGTAWCPVLIISLAVDVEMSPFLLPNVRNLEVFFSIPEVCYQENI